MNRFAKLLAFLFLAAGTGACVDGATVGHEPQLLSCHETEDGGLECSPADDDSGGEDDGDPSTCHDWDSDGDGTPADEGEDPDEDGLACGEDGDDDGDGVEDGADGDDDGDGVDDGEDCDHEEPGDDHEEEPCASGECEPPGDDEPPPGDDEPPPGDDEPPPGDGDGEPPHDEPPPGDGDGV